MNSEIILNIFPVPINQGWNQNLMADMNPENNKGVLRNQLRLVRRGNGKKKTKNL